MYRAETEQERAAKLNACLSKVLNAMKPPEKITVSEWADKNRRLSSEASAEVGKWRTSRTPYMLDILNSFNDPKVEHIVVVAASQVGKSEAINNMIGYCITQDPGPILLVEPTVDDAKAYSKERIAPMIRETKCLRKAVAAPKSRDSSNTVLQKAFLGGMLTLTGSTEAHALCSRPIRYLFGDERDRWALSAGSEGNPWELATARTTTFYNRKMVEVSTPTIKDASNIAAAFETGTKERWMSECRHCGEYSEVTFDQIRFPHNELGTDEKGQKVFEIEEIFYVCPKCGGISTEFEVKKQPAKWVAEVPEALKLQKTRSFWLNAWTSPWADWYRICIQYLQAQGDNAKLQAVWNTKFGWLWENRGDLASEDDIMARREEYAAELPDGVLALTCGVDTQDNRLEYEVVGYGHFGEKWGIKKGIIMGRPDTDEVWERLDDVIDHKYTFADGVSLKISLTFVDEGGHFTKEVRLRCLERFHKNVFAIKGAAGNRDIPYTSPPKRQNIVIGDEKNTKRLIPTWVYEIGVNAGKQKIFDDLKVQTPGARYCHFPKRDDYGKAYFKSLMSEHLVYDKKKKTNPWQWEKIPGHERNEGLDCRNYANAAFEVVDPDLDAMENRLRNIRAGKVPEKKKRKKPPARRRDNGFNDW
ncbi:MAG: phage terminase large subunit family protein [Lachnospiraceae bacterium]|nr:phage terminase large subunit family protein [Lachnospiraceae bacterium]